MKAKLLNYDFCLSLNNTSILFKSNSIDCVPHWWAIMLVFYFLRRFKKIFKIEKKIFFLIKKEVEAFRVFIHPL